MPAPFDTATNLSAIGEIRHGFFGRRSGDQSDFNMSEKFGSPETVTTNLARAVDAIGVPNTQLAQLTQTHSNRVVTINPDSQLSSRPDADGLVTNQPGIVLCILTADCTPILFADDSAQIIGACHAGWQGAVAGVITNTIAAMTALGANPMNIKAAIGPTISAPNYEVGPEFTASLLAKDPKAFSLFHIPEGKNREHFDLPGYAASQISGAGLPTPIKTGGCTFANPDQFFSHRHASASLSAPGRQVALISLQ